MSICDCSIFELSKRIREGALSITQVVQACIDRIGQRDSDLKAFVEVWEAQALDEAKARQSELDSGHDRGLMHGVPIAIKDIVDICGARTRGGTTWYGEKPVEADAVLVSNLRSAGAIILGKTVTTEFAGFDPSPTMNPLDPSRTPGGSSSGSAAAVAAGMCFMAVGTQTGGSINRPASYCGVAGYKPQFGTVSTDGVIPLSVNLDHPGPIAKRSADCWIGWQAMLSEQSPMADLPAPKLPATISVTEEFFLEECDPVILKVYDTVKNSLSGAGSQIDDVDLPVDFEEILVMHRRIMAYDAAGVHEDDFRRDASLFSFHFHALIEEGLNLTEADYKQALAFQTQSKQVLGEFLVENGPLLVPATTGPAPGRETTGNPRFNSPWSFSGLPSLSFVAGADEKMFPICLQLIGVNPHELFSAAAFIESLVLAQ